MSSISGVDLSSQLGNIQKQMFSKIDTNGDGSVDKSEFVSARPKGVSESDATSLFDSIDSGKSGKLTQAQLSDGMEKNRPDKKGDTSSLGGNLSPQVLGALIQILQQAQGQSSGSTGSQPSSSDMFSKIDTDGNGSVSKAEFVNSRPDGVSESQANTLFSKIDKNGTGSVTQSQLEEAMKNGPAGGMMPPMGASSSSSSGSNLPDILSLLGDSSKTSGSTSKPSSSDMFKHVDTDGNGSVSKAEFINSRPDGMSEADATSLFSKIDSKGTGSVTQAQLEDGMKDAPGGGMMPPMFGGLDDSNGLFGSSDDSSSSKSSDSNDLIAQLLKAIESYKSTGYSGANASNSMASSLAALI